MAPPPPPLGDAAKAYVGEIGGTTQEITKAMSKEFGLDKTLSEQLLICGAKVLCVDLGFCYFPGKPVLELIFKKAPHRRLKGGHA